MSPSTRRPHVLIVGAGLGGLTLAQALRKQGITFEIFERDAGIHSRFQGWAIALHKTLADFKASMPEDLGSVQTTNHLLPLQERPEFTVYVDNKPVARTTGDREEELLRSNRSKLRDYLSTHLDIKWNKMFTHIEEKEDSVTLHFDDGTSATGDVLVGADGVHSKVRQYLFDGIDHLRNLPLGMVIGQATLNKEQYQRQLQLAHSAYNVLIGERDRLFVGLNSIDPDAQHGHYYWIYAFYDKAVENGPIWTASASKQEQYDYVIQETQEALDPKFLEIVKLTKVDDIMSPPLIIKDLLLDSMPNRKITLLGDACHAMGPHRGEGGNHALQDALNLARVLARTEPDRMLHDLNEYQSEMLERGRQAVRNTRAVADSNEIAATAGWSNLSKPIRPETQAVEAH